MKVVTNGGILSVSVSQVKEALPLIDVDTLYSIASRKDGRLLFEILEEKENGDFLISLLSKDGQWFQAELTLREF